ncbi:MAG: right-handed parallel beta-helix repeat-containing protein [Polyangiales bacterium]
MNRVRWIVLACAMAATACSGESLTVGEIDASTGASSDAGGDASASATDAQVADAGAVDVAASDTGVIEDVSTDAGAIEDVSADTGVTDAGAPMDNGPADADTADATDADPVDAGATDADPVDAGDADPADAGAADARVLPTVGSLVVRFVNNPSNAQVTVTGPAAFSRTLDATAVLNDLAFGAYTVAAQRTVLGGLSYVPTPTRETVQVSAETGVDAPAVVTVTYGAMNTPPTLSTEATQTLYAGARAPTLVPFTVNDAEDGPSGLTPTVVSSAPSMVTASVVRDGSGWALSLLPGTVEATATVTLSVTDSQNATSTFAVTVNVSTAGVVTTNANSGPGSLRAVIAAVAAGATVTFAPSVVSPITLTSSIAIPRAITIQGPGAGALTIDGATRVQLFYVTAPLTVTGLTFNGGYSGSYGGAIQVPGAATPLTVSDCAFTNNASEMLGGAIYTASNLTLTRSTFTSNRSNNGGGVTASGPTSVVTDCTFTSNRATLHYGGGFYAYAGMRTSIEGCSFVSNSSNNLGGGVAIASVYGAMTVTNSTFAGNSATNYGSAVVLNAPALRMSFCTVTGSTGSPALHITTGGPFILQNSIVAGNARGDFSPFGMYQSDDYNIIGGVMGASFSARDNDVVGEVVALDPVSGYGGATPTVRLPASSIAVDAIPAEACLAGTTAVSVDQRGRARPAGARCDIGAFERQSDD